VTTKRVECVYQVGKDFGAVAVEALMSYVDNKEYANCLQWINFEMSAKAPKLIPVFVP